MNEKIDFVIPWVDESDEKWQEEIARYLPGDKDAEACRFRDWGLLKYWFRGVEAFAPWVNRIHFVTCGQWPDWLDKNHPKLHLVDHRDYIPEEHLPCFSSHPIELNLHRIPGLSEQFVYFNDDTFLLRPLSPELFFRNGLPRLRASLESRTPVNNGIYCYINNSIALAAHFDVPACIRRNRRKWFDPFLGGPRTVLRNYLYLNHIPYTNLSNNNHLPTPYRKDLLEDVWQALPELLSRTSSHRFRQDDDVNQWLFHNWAVVQGAFWPIRASQLGAFRMITDRRTAEAAADLVTNQKFGMVCINDDVVLPDDLDSSCHRLKQAFQTILPQRSSFERY